MSYNGTEAEKEARRLWVRNNPEKNRAHFNKWRLSHLAEDARRKYASNAFRNALKLHRIPKWANIELIKKFYNECPQGYHVDHIIPLKGKFVSGFHIETNLQYLSASENLSKGNRFIII